MSLSAAGQRSQRVTFLRATAVRDALGQKTSDDGDFGPIGERWAKVLFGSGAERRAAGVEGAVQTATFRLLLDSLTRTIGPSDRIVHAGLTYDVTGIAPIGRSEIEFTGVASRG